MIRDALEVMLFGMLGIFIVMGVIIAVIKVLGRAKKTDEQTR